MSVLTYVDVCLGMSRYNCNRYNEDEAKKARDAQEVGYFVFAIDYNTSFTLTSP